MLIIVSARLAVRVIKMATPLSTMTFDLSVSKYIEINGHKYVDVQIAEIGNRRSFLVNSKLRQASVEVRLMKS